MRRRIGARLTLALLAAFASLAFVHYGASRRDGSSDGSTDGDEAS